MEKLIIYEKSTCTTCRKVKAILKEKRIAYDAINYYKKPFTRVGLKNLLTHMKMRPREMLRTKEVVYKKLGLAKKELSDDVLIDLMIQYPDLLQRPIAVKGSKVMLARPAETINALL